MSGNSEWYDALRTDIKDLGNDPLHWYNAINTFCILARPTSADVLPMDFLVLLQQMATVLITAIKEGRSLLDKNRSEMLEKVHFKWIEEKIGLRNKFDAQNKARNMS